VYTGCGRNTSYEVSELHTNIVIVFIGTVSTVVVLVTEAPPGNALEVVAAEPSVGITVDGVTDRLGLIGIITTIIISITHPLRRDADLAKALPMLTKLLYIQHG